MQLLWINVFLDISAVVAIASGDPVDSLLETDPYSIKDRLLTQEMWREVLLLSLY
jgi:magnesium-transporting ATPase (P-type)